MKELKAITIRAPWPWWIMSTEPWRKPVENRGRGTSHRGLVAIHVSQTMIHGEYAATVGLVQRCIPEATLPTWLELQGWLGKIVGVVDLTRCGQIQSRWTDPFQIQLEMLRPVQLETFVPARGCQAVPWRVPAAIAEQVWAQLEPGKTTGGVPKNPPGGGAR